MKEAESITGMAAGLAARIWQAWDRFWFTPANPTTLGVMRICAGLLTLYIHLAYTPDLFDFFGKDAWVSLARVDRNRHESPWTAPSLNWEFDIPNLYVPNEEKIRADFFTWLASMPNDKATRQRVIEWIKRPDESPPDVYIPQYVRALEAGPADDFQPTRPSEYPIGPTKWQIIRFIKNLPEDPAAHQAKIAYMREWGFDPDQLYRKGGNYWSVWFHVTDPGWMVFTHAVILLVMFFFTIGFCTRITAVLTWLAALSYIQRSTITLFGGDTMMNILLIYLMIAPSGAALSVDRLLRRWWAVRQARRQGLPPPEETPLEPSILANFASRLFMVHFCIIYLASGLAKLLGGFWWNGNAVYYTMANYEFAPLHYQYYLDMMRWLAQHRFWWEVVISGGTFSTVALEIGFPFLVWNRRLRPFMVAGSITLHVFIAIFMGLTAFSLLMATLVLSFIPGEVMERIVDGLRRRFFGDPRPSPAKPRAVAVDSDPPADELADDKAEPEAVLQGAASGAETAITVEKEKGKRKKEKPA
jgi:hypothetical protein